MDLTNSINYTEFRKQYNVPSDHMRIILKELGYSRERVGTEQYITGENPYDVSDEYYLKHGVMEYRHKMNCDNTKTGNFFEYEINTSEGIGRVGVSTFTDASVKPITPALKREPNKTPKSVLVPANKGAEMMLRKAEPPTAQAITTTPVVGMDALQVLVSALQAVQAPQQPPDPLQAQRDLLEAAENRFLLTGEQVGALVGWSKSTITSKKSGFKKLGFQFEKVKEGSATLWRVSQY
jgi:biotin operon repressor